jgi:hypothetical protein
VRAPDVTRNSPWNFAAYVGAVTAVLCVLGILLVGFTDPGLARFMGAGALLVVAGLLYGPSTLDMTGWTMAVYCMLPLGVLVFLGSPLVYALFVAFVAPHVEVRLK